MATGDQLEALVQKDVNSDGRLLVPKGATARSRVHQLLRIPGKENYYVVSLDFHTLEFDNKRARLVGRLEYVNFRNFRAGQSLRISGQPLFDDSTIPLWARRSVRACGGLFYIHGHPAALRLTPGALIRWKTVPAGDCEKNR